MTYFDIGASKCQRGSTIQREKEEEEKRGLWAKVIGGWCGSSGDVKDGEGKEEEVEVREKEFVIILFKSFAMSAVFILKYAMPFSSYVE